MSASDPPLQTLDAIIKEPSHSVNRVVNVRGTLVASSIDARLVCGAESLPVEMECGDVARELIRRGVAPYVGGPLLYDHEVIICAVLSRRADGGLSLRQVRTITVNPGKAGEEKVVSFI